MLEQDREMVERYLQYCKVTKNLSDSSIANYRVDLNHLLHHTHDFKSMDDIAMMDYFDIHVNPHFEPTSSGRKITSIKGFWKWLLKRKYVTELITDELVRPRIIPGVVTCPKVEKVNADIKQLIKSGHENLAMAVEISKYSALRRGDVVNLTYENIDFEEGTFTLYKTKTRKMVVKYVNMVLIEKIKKYCEKNGITSGRIILTNTKQPFTVDHFSRTIKKVGIDGMHQYRKTAITYAARNGNMKLAQELGDHSTQNTTSRYYVERDVEGMRSVMDKM